MEIETAETEVVRTWHECTHEERVERWENVQRVLLGLDEHAQQKHFDMGHWIKLTDCGTVGCIAGHCSLDPYFWELGLKATKKVTSSGEWFLAYESFERITQKILGSDGYQRVLIYNEFPNRLESTPTYSQACEMVAEFLTDLREGRITRNDFDHAKIRTHYGRPLESGWARDYPQEVA